MGLLRYYFYILYISDAPAHSYILILNPTISESLTLLYTVLYIHKSAVPGAAAWKFGAGSVRVLVSLGKMMFPASSAGCQAAAQRDREQHLFGFVWTRDSGPDGHDASIFRRVQCQDVFPWFSSATHVGDNSPP